MPFPPELSARMVAVRSELGGGDQSALGQLRAKLAKREAQGGYSQNVAELKQRIAEMEAGDGDSV